MPWDKWKPVRMDANTLGPIITHGITWIDLLAIKVHIWVQTGWNPIDVTSTSTTDMQEYAIDVSHFCSFLLCAMITNIR